MDGAFAVGNVVTTFSDNDIGAHSGWHNADGRGLVPSNPLQNPCGEINRLFRNQSALIRWARLPQCSSERSR